MATHYIDHSAANNGDGTDAAQAASGGAVGAFNGLIANLGSFAAGDTVWIRRSGTAEALSAVLTLWDGGGCYGWPKSTDPTYATRPAAGTSAGWDADADDYAEFTTASTTDILVRPTSATAAMGVRRIHMLTSSTSSSMRGVNLKGGSENTSFSYCKFESSAGGAGRLVYVERSSFNTFDNCVFLRSSASVTSTSWEGLLFIYGSGSSTPSYFNHVYSCSFDAGSIGDCGFGDAVFIRVGTSLTYCKNHTISNCTFTGAATKDTTGAGDAADPWMNLEGTNIKFLDCTIEDTETVTDYSKQSIYIHGADIKVERLKLIRGGLIRDDANSIRNTLGIYESTLINGASANANFFSLAGDTAKVTARGVDFDGATSEAVDVDGDDVDVLLVGCTYTGTVSTIAGARSYVTQLGAGALVGVWNKFTAGGLLTADAGVIRTSGVSAWSIRHLPVSGAVSGGLPMSIGSAENPTIFVNVASSGAKTFTLYAAYKNFSAATPDGNSFWIEIYYLNANNNLKLASSKGAALVADGSTWTGDTGLTVVRQSLAVTIPTAQVVSAVIYGALPFESSAYGFIDPLIEVS